MLILRLISFVLLLGGSYLLASWRYPWDGGLLLGLGMVGLGVSLCGRDALSVMRRELSLSRAGAMRLAALALAALVGLAARNLPPGADYTALLWLWLGALALFVATLWPVDGLRWRWPLSREETWALAALLLAALLARGVGLGRIPANMGGDEGTQALLALELVEPPLGNPFTTSWYSVPTMSFLAYGVVIRLLGATIAGARALSVVAGTLTVLTTFLLGRAWGGPRVGWVAALVVAFSAYHIHFSRLASNQIADPLIATLTFWLLWRALRHPTASPPAPTRPLAGMVAGAGWYAYFGARWVTVLVALLLGGRLLLAPRFWARQRRGLGLLAAGWLVVTLPLLLWYAKQPQDLLARHDAVSIFASGWLEREIVLTGASAAQLLWQQFLKAVTAFHFTPDPTFWYRPEAPLLDFVSGALLCVGMLAAIWRWRWPTRGATLLWWWATLGAAWVLTENPPSSQRGLLLIPPTALLIAWGVEFLLAQLPRSRRAQRLALAALLLPVIVLNLLFYFVSYTPRRIYGNPTAEIATQLAHFMEARPYPEATLYFFGPPYIYWDFGTLAYLQRGQAAVEIAPEEAPPADVGEAARFVLVLARQQELAAVVVQYPGGVQYTLTSATGQPLALIYDWHADR